MGICYTDRKKPNNVPTGGNSFNNYSSNSPPVKSKEVFDSK
jgi:hypothetical protein